MPLVTGVCAWLVVMALAASCAAAADSEEGDALEVEISRRVDVLAKALASPDEATRRKARDGLLALEKAYIERLWAHVEDSDPEVRARVRDVLGKSLTDARIRRVLAKLPRDERTRLVALQKAQPSIMADVFSDNMEARIAAVKRLGKLKDPDALAAPLLVMCLRHPSVRLVGAAAAASDREHYRSAALAEALTEVLVRMIGEYDYSYHSYRLMSARFSSDDEEVEAPPAIAALSALKTIKHPGAAPGLLKALEQNTWDDGGMGVEIAEALAATDEKRIIPLLIKRLELSRRQSTISYDEVRITRASSDLPLLVLVKMTGQSPAAYKFVRYDDGNGWSAFGFTGNTDRKAAIEMFRDWWEKNKDTEAYRNIEPLALKAKPAGQAASTQTATSSAAETVDIPPSDLPERFAKQTDRHVEGFRERRFKTRRAEQRKLLKLHEAYLAAMASCADSENEQVRKEMLAAMADVIVHVRIAGVLAEMDRDNRGRVARLRDQKPEIVERFYGLSWRGQERSLKSIAQIEDAEALAEPLLIAALDHPSSSIVVAAAEAVKTGRYRSDELVDKLTDKLFGAAADAVDYPAWRYYYGGEEQTAILEALRKLESPRPVPKLIVLMQRGRARYDDDNARMLADLIAAGKDKRAIPYLMEGLEATVSGHSWSSGSMTVTFASCDAPLMALLKLTEQDPAEYGFVYWPHDYGHRIKPYGFRDDKSREKAIKKFKDWWAKNKDEPPYRNLQPLPIPALPEDEDE